MAVPADDKQVKLIINDRSHTFTFEPKHIDSVSEKYDVGPNKTRTPAAGPMANIGNDFNGISKRVVINGELIDTEETVLTGNNAPVITDKLMMKYYLESLADGIQTPFTFESYLSEYSLESSGGTTTIYGKEIPGTWVPTEGYIDGLSFDTQEAENQKIMFDMTIWVAGA